MPDEPPQTPEDGKVLVFRNPTGEPVSVPAEIVAAAQVVYQAYMAKVAGTSWEMVALQFNYPSASAAKADVERYVREGAALVSDYSRQVLLELEMARLDALQTAIWEMAMGGSIAAVGEVRQLVKTRFEMIRSMDDKVADHTRTVVIPVGSGAYTAMLQQVVQESEHDASTALLPGSGDSDE